MKLFEVLEKNFSWNLKKSGKNKYTGQIFADDETHEIVYEGPDKATNAWTMTYQPYEGDNFKEFVSALTKMTYQFLETQDPDMLRFIVFVDMLDDKKQKEYREADLVKKIVKKVGLPGEYTIKDSKGHTGKSGDPRGETFEFLIRKPGYDESF